MLDKESLSVYIFNVANSSHLKFKVSYEASDGIYSQNKGQGNQQMLPHNFQLV